LDLTKTNSQDDEDKVITGKGENLFVKKDEENSLAGAHLTVNTKTRKTVKKDSEEEKKPIKILSETEQKKEENTKGSRR
jgi:lipopolysaccharide export system protein LptA